MNARGLETLASGHVRFRFTHAGKKYSGTYATAEEASAVRDEMLRRLATGRVVVAHDRSIAKLGASFMASRAGNRGHYTEKKRWEKFIAAAPFAMRPLSTVSRGDILSWLDALPHDADGASLPEEPSAFVADAQALPQPPPLVLYLGARS